MRVSVWCLILMGSLCLFACDTSSSGDDQDASRSDTGLDTEPPLPAAELWSDPDTWGGALPAAGEDLTIPAGQRVVLDLDEPVVVGGLTIEGVLEFDDSGDRHLTADWILVDDGLLRIGTPESPFTNNASITLADTDTEESIRGLGTRGIIISGGRVDFHGVAPSPTWTQLAEHAEAGATSLTLTEEVDWSVGDEVVIAPTEYYGQSETEVHTLGSASGTTLGLAGSLSSFRWGRLQYVEASGMTLEPTTDITERVLDERAEIGVLTRNVVVQAPDDALWQNDGFGAHMVVGFLGSLRVSGTQFVRVGQRGRKARYPLHWHHVSYDGASELTDATGQFLRNSVITQSANRCVVIHATNGLNVQGNICHNISGHAFFLEDAVEQRNTLDGNLAIHIRNPANPLLNHEGNVFQGGSSGFWLTHPNNTITHNVAADAEGVGFWLSYPETSLGESKDVAGNPSVAQFGVFDDNVAHSNQKLGLNLDWVVVDDEGNVSPHSYSPTTDGVAGRYDNWVRFALNRFTTYKHGEGGMWNRAAWPDYIDWVSADNELTFFAGAGAHGNIQGALIVGRSLNDRTPHPQSAPPVAVASYHSTFDVRDNTIVNFDFVPGQPSGAFKTDDYYIRAVDKGLIRNDINTLINAHPGYRSQPILAENWTLAGALWDPHGYWGPQERYWVYDNPFLTHDATCDAVEPAGQNGMSCEGPYYGVQEFVLDQGNARWDAWMPIEAERLDTQSGQSVGMWTVGDGNLAPKLANMRHFSVYQGAHVVLRFPGSPMPSDVGLTIENAFRTDDAFVLALQFDGNVTAAGYLTTYYNYVDVESWPSDSLNSHLKRSFTPVANLQAVVDAPVEAIWQDSANNLVWLKITGGIPAAYTEAGEHDLYQPMFLRLHPAP